MAASPVAAEAWRAFNNAFSAKVLPVSSASPIPNSDCGRMATSKSDNIRLISCSLPALLLAMTILSGNLPTRSPQRDSAASCAEMISAMPRHARSSIAASSSGLNAWPSAVPCTSIKCPASFMTTFMSVSASESSA